MPLQYQYVPVVQPVPSYQPQDQLGQLRAAQYQQPMVVQQPQQASQGIIWTQGEAGAKAYMVAPGASVMLMDSEAQSFYIKSADPSGMPLPLRIFDYTERQAAPVQIPATAAVPAATDYATRAELNELRAQIAAMSRSHTQDVSVTIGKENTNGQSVVPSAQQEQ